MKKVHAAATLAEAHLLVDLLADRGIRARIFNANASSLAGELPIEAALPQVWVDDSAHAERARGVIDEFQRCRRSLRASARPAGKTTPGLSSFAGTAARGSRARKWGQVGKLT